MRRHIIAAVVVAAALSACSKQERLAPPAPSFDLAVVQPAPWSAPAPVPPAPMPPLAPMVDIAERDCLAEAIYFEGRGEPREGQIAVAHVVLNRAASKAYPERICAVIREGEELGKGRCQFHWRCDGLPDVPTDLAAWRTAQDVADQVLAGGDDDPTQGALYFHATHVTPRWATKLRRTARIGSHVYYAE